MEQKKKAAKIVLSSLGRAQYNKACMAVYYIDGLEKVVDHYDSPRVNAFMVDMKANGFLSDSQYQQLMRTYHNYRNQLATAIGEDKFNSIMLEEQELEVEKEKLRQQASSEREGNASIIYVK